MRSLMALGLVLLIGCSSSQTREQEATDLVYEARELAIAGETTEAIEVYKEALDLVPDWTQVRMDLARLQFEKGKTHFFNHLEREQEAEEATGAGRNDQAKELLEISVKEKEIADALLREASLDVQKVIQSNPSEDNLLNGYLYLGHIEAFYKNWTEAKRYYDRAMAMEPTGEALTKITEALALVESEIDKQAEKEIGTPPQ
jgi:tetratricopeptide (TPR) repeat protein